MKGIILFVLCMFLLFICNFCTNVNNNESEFEIKGFRMINGKESFLFTFTLNDIEAIDWNNQSFKIKKGSQKKMETGKFSPGYNCEYLTIKYKNKEQILNIYNYGSSCPFILKDNPFIYHFQVSILSNDDWLVIIPIKDSLGETAYDNLFDKEVFQFLIKNKKINAKNWVVLNNSFTPINSVNKNFCKDFENKFVDYKSNWFKILKYIKSSNKSACCSNRK